MQHIENLKACRIRAGLTQIEVASALSVNQTAISHWENGRVRPMSDKLPLLAKLYGCSIDELFEQKGGNEMRNSNASERD